MADLCERLLEVDDLHVSYGGIKALRGISLHVNKGEMISVIGTNGAGKSTLLKSIAGALVPQSGKISFNGKPTPNRTHKYVENGICLVPEGRQIFVNLSVKENLRVGAYLEKKQSVINERIEEVFELFPRLKEREKQMSGTLSGGEQQMLAVGRALMAKPTLLMLDEPSLGLAPIIIDEMFDKFIQVNRELGTTMLIVEQNAQLALESTSRSYVLSVGEITMSGKSSDLANNEEFRKAYMGF